MNLEFLGIVLVRSIVAIGGILSVYFGYRLFHVAVERQGEFTLKHGQHVSLALRDVGPGTFFALFGAIVLVVSLLKPMTYSREELGSDRSALELSGSDMSSRFFQREHGTSGQDVEIDEGDGGMQYSREEAAGATGNSYISETNTVTVE